jgi:hypothetical protein
LEGRPTEILVSAVLNESKYKSVYHVNVLEEVITKTESSIQFEPFEVKFLKFEL